MKTFKVLRKVQDMYTEIFNNLLILTGFSFIAWKRNRLRTGTMGQEGDCLLGMKP
jgi:hypothetical protein